jgi:hypothetical protein
VAGTSTLTSQFVSVRDYTITTGGLYTAVNAVQTTTGQLSGLTGASPLVTQFISVRDYTITTGGLYTAVNALQTTTSGLTTTTNGLTTTVGQLGGLTGTSTLVTQFISIRDYTIAVGDCTLQSQA